MQLRASKKCVPALPPRCCVCMDVVSLGKSSVSCNAISGDQAHHVCKGCLQGLVLMGSEPVKLRSSVGSTQCPWRGNNPVTEHCCAPGWTFEQVAPLLEQVTLTKYINNLSSMLSTLLEAQQDQGCRVFGRRFSGRWELEDERLREYRLHIAENILTLRCPRCSRVWDSYDGCDALNCESCGAAFCALCLEDCGRDAHSHAARFHGTYFGGLARFRRTHADRRRRGVAAFLLALPEPLDVRLRLLDVCATDLEALGVRRSEIASLLLVGDRVSLCITLTHLLSCLSEAGYSYTMGLARRLRLMASLILPMAVHLTAAISISTALILLWMVLYWAAGLMSKARRAVFFVLAVHAGIETLRLIAVVALAFCLFGCGINIMRKCMPRASEEPWSGGKHMTKLARSKSA